MSDVETSTSIDRRRSPMALLIAAAAAVVFVLAIGALARDADVDVDEFTDSSTTVPSVAPPSVAPPSSAPSTATTATAPMPDVGPIVIEGTTDNLAAPITLVGGPSARESTLALVRLAPDTVFTRTVTSSLDPGARAPATSVGDQIVFSDGDRVVRIDGTLTEPDDVELGSGSDVHRRDGNSVWTVDDGRLVARSAEDGTVIEDVGPVVDLLRAPLTGGAFIVAVDGAAGVWFPGGRAGRVATSFIDSTPTETWFVERGNLLVADTAPFLVRRTIEVDDDLVLLGPGAISPDRARAALRVAESGRSRLAIADLDTGAVTTYDVAAGRSAPLWLSDSDVLVLGEESAGRIPLWRIDLDLASFPGLVSPTLVADLAGDRTWTLLDTSVETTSG